MVAGANLYSRPDMGWNYYVPQEKSGFSEGAYIASLTPEGSTIAVWGYRPELYLSSGRVQATRDTNMSRFFKYGEGLSRYYKRRFLEDMQKHPAALFIDALDTSCCDTNRRETQAFELIPPIRDYIQAHYVFIGVKNKDRYYLRRDLAGPGASASE